MYSAVLNTLKIALLLNHAVQLVFTLHRKTNFLDKVKKEQHNVGLYQKYV